MLGTFLLFIFCYILGSIPFGLIIVKLVKNVDIRQYGSGNIGATNAFRLLGLSMGIIVALLDISKGFLAVAIAKFFFPEQAVIILLAGVIAVAGHNWPIFLKFKGGRGVATSVGVLVNLAPQSILITFLVWITIVVLTQYVSLASITGAILVPLLMLVFGQDRVFITFAVLIAIFVIYRHLPNIKRLLAGTENKVSLKNRLDK